MRYGHSLNHLTNQSERSKPGRPWQQTFRWSGLVAMIFVTICAYGVQDNPALHAVTRSSHSSHAAGNHQDPSSSQQTSDDYKELMEEAGRLEQKLAQGVQFPAPRTQSRLLPLVPASSSFFIALPNYGEALHQASQIFHQELQESAVLKNFWQTKVGMAGMIADEVIEKVYQLTQFMGDEIIVSGTVKSTGGSAVFIAEARKPGLAAFLRQLVGQYADKTEPPVRVYTPEQLALAKAQPSHKPLLVLVRPDLVIASENLAVLKSFNAQLTHGGPKFTSSPFGEKIAREYQNGVAVVFGADLHQLLSLRPHQNAKDEAVLNQTGVADVRYLVGEAQYAGGIASSNAELSFLGPRKGIVGLLAAPSPLTGLDFISRDAAYVGAFNLKNFGEVFDVIKDIAASANPMADAGIAQVEEQLKINLKNDLFSKFSGQIVAGVDGPILPNPAWKVIAQLTDSNGMERTLKQLITMAGANQALNLKVDQETEGGVNYYIFHVPTGPKPVEVVCAFANGFLVVGGSQTIVKEAIEIRQSGNSLSRSSELQDLLPREQGNGASGIIYQNLGRILRSLSQQVPPEQAQLFEMITQHGKPSATSLYASEDAIRIMSRSNGFDPTALVVAAIVIPNLIQAKTAATRSAAAANVRSLVLAESQYQITYDHYAPDLATLGPGPGGNCDTPSESHACSVDAKLGCPDKWCFGNGYKFNITGVCDGKACSDYVILAAPTNADSGGKSYCATADGVVRSQSGSVSKGPLSVSECQSWPSL